MSQEPRANADAAPSPPAPTPARAAPPQGIIPEAGINDAEPESTLWIGRTHWAHSIGLIALWVLVAALVSTACVWLVSRGSVSRPAAWRWGGLIVGLMAVYVVIRILWIVLSCRYRLTTQRLFLERGVFSQTIDQTELVRVDDVRVRRTLMDRLLGLGTVDILTTDQTDRSVVLEGVRDPQAVAEHVRECMRRLRRKSLYVENI